MKGKEKVESSLCVDHMLWLLLLRTVTQENIEDRQVIDIKSMK